MNVAIAVTSKPAASSRWKPMRSASYSFSRVKLICVWIASACADAMRRRGRLSRRRGTGARRGDGQRERGQRVEQRALLPGEQARHVMLRHVRDFVREHGRELGLALREEDETGVDADVAAGQRERVDGRIADREELEVLAAVGHRGDEAMAELVQVVVDFGVVEIGARGADLPHDASRRACVPAAGESIDCDSSPRSGSPCACATPARQRGGSERLRGERHRHERGDERRSRAAGSGRVQAGRWVQEGVIDRYGSAVDANAKMRRRYPKFKRRRPPWRAR